MRPERFLNNLDLRVEIQEVYLHSFLFKLAQKLVGIFIPLYLLETGYSPFHVILFFLIYYSTYIFISIPNANIVSQLGYKTSALVSSPVILAYYFFLRNLQVSIPELAALGFLGGIGYNLYWTGMNSEVARSSHEEKRNEEAGKYSAVLRLPAVISPLIGGLILASLTFKSLFLFTIILIGLSFTPFILSREHHDGMDLKIIEFWRQTEKTDFLTFAFKGMNSIGKKVLWPLYLALVIQGSLSIGGAGSILALGGSVTSFMIGKVTNEENRSKIILTGALLASTSYIIMSQVTTPLAAIAVSGFNGLTYMAAGIPIYSEAMDHSSKEDIIEYFAFREISLAAGRITALLALLGLLYLLPEAIALTGGFIFIAATVLITGLVGSRMS
jgi:MFS family permease